MHNLHMCLRLIVYGMWRLRAVQFALWQHMVSSTPKKCCRLALFVINSQEESEAGSLDILDRT